MNKRQMLSQVRWLVGTTMWSEGSAISVLPAGTALVPGKSAVVAANQFNIDLLAKIRYPAAIVTDGGFAPDQEYGNLGEYSVNVQILQEHYGDEWGAATLLGAQRTTTAGSSLHRGLLEIVPPLRAALVRRGREAGLAMRVASDRESEDVMGNSASGAPLLGQTLTLAAFISDDEVGEYPSPKVLTGALASGTVTLTWTAPAARFDNANRYSRVVRKATSAPTTIADGTVLSSTASSGYTNAPGSGTWYYGIASLYDEDEGERTGTLRTAGPFTI